MPYVGIMLSSSLRFLAALVIVLVFVGGAPQRAGAQTFEFTPSGGFLSGSTIFSTLTITATATSNFITSQPNSAQYDITGITGTFDGDAITGLLAPGTLVGGRSVNNAVFTGSSGLTGTILLSRDDANGHLSEGFGFTTSAGNFLVCDQDCITNNGLIDANLRVSDSSGLIVGSLGYFTSVQVPGPLAGAGMLSWLAVMLMGLAWRRQWLLGRIRAWLAVVRQGKAQAA